MKNLRLKKYKKKLHEMQNYKQKKFIQYESKCTYGQTCMNILFKESF